MPYQPGYLNTPKPKLLPLAAVFIGTLLGCSNLPDEPADVADSIHTAMVQVGLKGVAVRQDRENGVVTLIGHVARESDRSQAESIAKFIAGGQVVLNRITLTSNSAERSVKKGLSDLEKRKERRLEAARIPDKLHGGPASAVTNLAIDQPRAVDSETKSAPAEPAEPAVRDASPRANARQAKAQ